MNQRILVGAMALCGALGLVPAGAHGQIPVDTSRTDNLPIGQGHLSLGAATITLSDGNLQVVFIPLDERILRLVTKDSYESTQGMLAQQRRAIDSVLAATGVPTPGIAFVSFQSLAQNTRFDPTQLTLNVHGQPLRAVAVIPMSATFSNQQLDIRQQVQALYIFRRDIPVRESFTVSYLNATSDDWANRLARFDAERSRILGTVRARRDTMRP